MLGLAGTPASPWAPAPRLAHSHLGGYLPPMLWAEGDPYPIPTWHHPPPNRAVGAVITPQPQPGSKIFSHKNLVYTRSWVRRELKPSL